ncbi:MAG: hypothetical protein V3U30_03675 [Thermoplasmata archaeon]
MTEGVYVRTRISLKVFQEMERLADLLGVSVYQLVRDLVTQGVRVHLGTAKERARLKAEHEAELAVLEEAEVSALEELS